jgi:hypothetical protein
VFIINLKELKMKKLFLIVFSILALTACNDDNSANAVKPISDLSPTEQLSNCIAEDNCTENEVISAYSLPVMPTESEDNATLKGVDSNKNGVRDSRERLVTLKHYKDEDRVNILIKSIQAYEKSVDAYKEGDVDKVKQLRREQQLYNACYWRIYRESPGLLESRWDTDERDKLEKDMDSFVNMKVIVSIPIEELKEECPKLISK